MSAPSPMMTDEPAARLDLLHKNIRKFGTITNTLDTACALSGEIEAVPTAQPRA